MGRDTMLLAGTNEVATFPYFLVSLLAGLPRTRGVERLMERRSQ